MARQPRFFVDGGALHVIQRGNNRVPIFGGSADYRNFDRCLREACESNGVAIHAYVFMTNHVHLVVTPKHADSLPRTLQSVGRRYVQYFNRAHSRTGTLWEGRYRATLIDTDAYLLACMRYVELNPVRAGIVNNPQDYLWSSHRANAYGDADPTVTLHEVYRGLADTDEKRACAYRALFELPLPTAVVDRIRETTNKNWALGCARFRRHIEEVAGRRAAPARRGPSGSDSKH